MSDLSRILVVDDEPAIRLFLSEELRQEGYEVMEAASGEEALSLLDSTPVDLVLLDQVMDGLNGLEVMARIQDRPQPPEVIMLTAHASLDSAISTLRFGGCDYLVKPSSTEELLTSVAKGIARRRQALYQQSLLQTIYQSARQLRADSLPDGLSDGSPADRPLDGDLNEVFDSSSRYLAARGLRLDRERQTVTRDGDPVDLTPTELRLLGALIEAAGRPLSYTELARDVYGLALEPWEARDALSTHIWRLRRKLGDAPDGEPYIVNVRGVGYRFNDDP
jgi:two-component system response regulator RegX3